LIPRKIKNNKLALKRKTKNMKKIITLVLTVFALTINAQTDIQKANRIDSIFSEYAKKNQFNGSVLISKKDKILLSKGYGMANFSYDVPNTATTKFKLASVSKQFTAMAILMLHEKGKLSVDDKLNKYIPDYPAGEKISIHHLLTHSSGIPNVTDLPKFDSIMVLPHTLEKTISYTKKLPLEFEPGSKFKYSNSGYILLSFIIEKTSGKNYGGFMKENIFEPLGMKNSGLYNQMEVMKNVAVGYHMGENEMEEVNYVDMSLPSGAGSLYSTVEDMFIWDRAFYSEKLVKKATLEKMITPFKDNYAYGLKIDNYGGHKLVTHSGGIQGFATITNHFPEDELYIVVLKNVENQTLFPANKVCKAIMYDQKFDLPIERKIASVDKKVFDKLVGNYELQPGFVLSITKADGKLYSQATGQGKCEIYPETEYKYFLKVVDAQLEFTKDDKGNATSLTLFQGGAKMPAKKLN